MLLVVINPQKFIETGFRINFGTIESDYKIISTFFCVFVKLIPNESIKITFQKTHSFTKSDFFF